MGPIPGGSGGSEARDTPSGPAEPGGAPGGNGPGGVRPSVPKEGGPGRGGLTSGLPVPRSGGGPSRAGMRDPPRAGGGHAWRTEASPSPGRVLTSRGALGVPSGGERRRQVMRVLQLPAPPRRYRYGSPARNGARQRP